MPTATNTKTFLTIFLLVGACQAAEEENSRALFVELCEDVGTECNQHPPDSYNHFECVAGALEADVVIAEPRMCDDAADVLHDAISGAAEQDPDDRVAGCEGLAPQDDAAVLQCFSR